MYKTRDQILTDALNNISDNILKGEGSLVYNVLSAASYEEEALYSEADYLLQQLDPETADFEFLVLLAKQRGITPDDASPCVVRIVADAELPIGSRFSLSSFNYEVIAELTEELNYSARCEEPGTAPNGLMGVLTPITFIPNLSVATITEILVAGADADNKETLYKKYKSSFNNQSFAGNVAAYTRYMDDYDGVGGCKVHPSWAGAGTVKCVLIGADFKPVSDYLIEQITTDAYKEVVPIGADCTIVSATSKAVNVVLGITYVSGYDWESCKDSISEILEKCFAESRQGWEDTGSDGYVVIYLSRIQAALLDVEGILDITSTTFNGQGSSYALQPDEIPILGTVSEAS